MSGIIAIKKALARVLMVAGLVFGPCFSGDVVAHLTCPPQLFSFPYFKTYATNLLPFRLYGGETAKNVSK